MVPFIGQVQPLAFNFAPKGWALCDGQLLPISQNTALFSLLGTTYGGDGRNTFALPDLRSRVPVHFGTSQTGEHFALGEMAGVETVTLNVTQLPVHNHAFLGASADATATIASDGAALAKAARPSGAPNNFYGPMSPPQPLNSESIASTGSTEAHDNLQPYLTINWCIALVGIFPSRN
jgi:microcystin-dependent protein